MLFAWPDVGNRRNLHAITLPAPWGSLIDSDDTSAAEVGLNSIPETDWPPILIPFFAFRIMVGCGLAMLALSWIGSWLALRGRLVTNRVMLRATFFSFPLGFIATLTGWFTAEVGRQPWVVWGQLRTAEAATPFLAPHDIAITLVLFGAIYLLIFVFGVVYIHRMLERGPGRSAEPQQPATPARPLSAISESV